MRIIPSQEKLGDVIDQLQYSIRQPFNHWNGLQNFQEQQLGEAGPSFFRAAPVTRHTILRICALATYRLDVATSAGGFVHGHDELQHEWARSDLNNYSCWIGSFARYL